MGCISNWKIIGILVDEPAFIFSNNKSILVNLSQPTSVLQMKSNSITYYFLRKGYATDKWRVTCVSRNNNVTTSLTKPLGNGEKRRTFI